LTNRKVDINIIRDIMLPTLKTLFITVLFGFLGSFGTYAMPAYARLIYWVVLINLGYFIYSISHRVTDWYFKNKKNVHPLIAYVFPSLITTLPLSLLVALATPFLMNKSLNIFTLLPYIHTASVNFRPCH